MTEDWQNGGFGLYIHWPFCQSKCPYCDFNSHVAAGIDQGRWQRAYLAEIDRIAALTPGRTLKSVFFGGGTPSLMDPALVGALIARIGARWTLANDIEITLEANPTSAEAGRFRAYRDGGVNRLSMGVQALNDDDLRRLGRLHDTAGALAAFATARGVFEQVSFDLIYARQGQSLRAWRDELNRALSMAVDHLSLYQLTIEAGTAFGDRHARGLLRGLPSDDLAADMYELTAELCAARGFHGYEVSNHARGGADSRHNLIYWNYGDYGGIGPGAHGRLTLGGRKFATVACRAPEKWLQAVENKGDGTGTTEALSGRDQATEMLLMGLRLTAGIDPRRFRALAGAPLSATVLQELAGAGLIDTSPEVLRVTSGGRLILNEILRRLLAAD